MTTAFNRWAERGRKARPALAVIAVLLTVGCLFFWLTSDVRRKKKAPAPDMPATTSQADNPAEAKPALSKNNEPAAPPLLSPQPPVVTKPPLAVKERQASFKDVGRSVISLGEDFQGNIWVGTEDKGLFRKSEVRDQKSEVRQQEPSGGRKSPESSGQWTHVAGLPDETIYAIASDRRGRVWLGTLNHGVHVYNGEEWQNYDVLDGPIGERIFAIASCPTDGDVWLATSAGLTRYSLKNDTWNHYTRADGLPSDQANALAFDQEGNIYVGTQCDGIALAKAAADYKKWTQVSGPDQLPALGRGEGLPCNLINALLVVRNGTIYAGTTAGLARSQDKGKTWTYMRGRDYTDKVRGRFGGAPAGWKPAPKEELDRLLPEDYITCLAEDDAGLLWIGFRQQGYVAINPKNDTQMFRGTKKTGLPDDYVNALSLALDLRHFVGTYGGGLTQVKPLSKEKEPNASPRPAHKPKLAERPRLPSTAQPPSSAELKDLFEKVKKQAMIQPGKEPPLVVPAGEDWKTRGDWLGRYGRYWAVLGALHSPENVVYPASLVKYRDQIGAHCKGYDSIRYWVHWLYTEDKRVLEMPPDYLNSRIVQGLTTETKRRREAEMDDHGEAYPMFHDGPHTFLTLEMPKGWWFVSLYCMNVNGQDSLNRSRDYTIDIRGETEIGQYRPHTASAEEMQSFDRAPRLAKARVMNFWGGTYKRFLVRGPGWYTLKMDRNYSFNTMLTAVMLDPVQAPRITKLGGRMFWTEREVDIRRWGPPKESKNAVRELLCDDILVQLEKMRVQAPERWVVVGRAYFLGLLRAYKALPGQEDPKVMERCSIKRNLCEFYLNQFREWEKSCDQLEMTTPRELELEKIKRVGKKFVNLEDH